MRAPLLIFFFLSICINSQSFALTSLCNLLMAATNFQETENFRKENKAKLEAYRVRFQTAIKERTDEFFEKISQRTADPLKLTTADTNFLNSLNINQGPATAAEPPPLISDETIKLLELAYFGDPSQKKTFSYRGHLWDAAFKAVERDPYFVWLKENRHDKRYVQVESDSIRIQDGKVTNPEIPTDPLELLKCTVYVCGPTMLPPRQSIIRIYRDLDPLMPVELQQLADSILHLAKLEVILGDYYAHHFRERPRSEETPDSLRLAPNLGTAMENLNHIYEELVRLYGKKFPRKSYERVIKLMGSDSSYTSLIRDIYTPAYRDGVEISEKYLLGHEEGITKLRSYLGVPPDLDMSLLLNVITRSPFILIDGYEITLGYIFNPQSNELIRGLAFYTQRAAALQDDASLLYEVLLELKMKAWKFRY